MYHINKFRRIAPTYNKGGPHDGMDNLDSHVSVEDTCNSRQFVMHRRCGSAPTLRSSAPLRAYTNGHLMRINRSDSVAMDQTFAGPLLTGSSWSGAMKGNVKATSYKNVALSKAPSSDGATKTTIEYKVDGLGRRVARMVGGKFDKAWLYRDSLRPIAEIKADGTFTHFMYASNDSLSSAPGALIRGGSLYRVVQDHIGSLRLVVNAQTGAVAQSIDYDANGRVLNETGTGFQTFGFAGGLYDATTGLVRFGARDYDPELGKWTNRDPIGFAGQQGNGHNCGAPGHLLTQTKSDPDRTCESYPK